MREYFARAILTVVAGAAVSFSLLAQTTPGPGGARATPDLSGVWSPADLEIGTSPSPFALSETAARDIAAGRVPAAGFSREEPPMQPWAAEKYKAAREARAPHERGREELDPILYPYCLPHTFPRVYTSPFAFEIVPTPERVYMHFESSHLIRRIYLDGQKHLEGWGPTFMGTSYGKWEADTLVVETENILSLNRQAWLDTFGHPFSDALRVTERIRRPNQGTLEIDFVFDDPEAYTRPWAGKKVFQLKPGWDMTEARICEDRLREDFLRDTQSGKPAGRP